LFVNSPCPPRQAQSPASLVARAGFFKMYAPCSPQRKTILARENISSFKEFLHRRFSIGFLYRFLWIAGLTGWKKVAAIAFQGFARAPRQMT